MSFSIGIVGLPNVGKSTLFKALTAKAVNITDEPFATVDSNVDVLEVPDDRLNAIQEIILAPTVIPTTIEFVDIAGLVRGSHAGEGLGNEFLNNIKNVDAILHLVRSFEADTIEHVEGSPNPQRDYDIVIKELQAKDRTIISRQRESLEEALQEGNREAQEELALLLEIEEAIENHTQPKKETGRIEAKRLGLLSTKPEMIVLSVGETSPSNDILPNALHLNVQEELDAADLSKEEQQELGITSHIDKLITAAYTSLNLITFFTIEGGQELHAWTTPNGTSASEAGGMIREDFLTNFETMEVLQWNDLIKADGWKAARQRGLLRTEDENYIIQDGDVVEFQTE